MKKIQFGNEEFECNNQENLLDAFFRNKIDVQFSCRSGTCQACLIQAESGNIPEESQIGLSQHLIETNHLLPCRCYPTSDMKLNSPCVDDIYNDAKIVGVKFLTENIAAVTIETNTALVSFKVGQFINIITTLDNTIRSYSITKPYKKHSNITIHVQKIPNGIFSTWVFEKAKIGDAIQIRYPLGACSVSRSNSSGTLLLATGSGLGAIIAITKEILNSGYKNKILLFHSSKTQSDLYLREELGALAAQYKNFSYQVCVFKEPALEKGIPLAYVDQLAFEKINCLIDWEVYLYGNPIMVKQASKRAIFLGCDEANIFSDAFDYGKHAQYNKSEAETNAFEFIEEEKRKFKPDTNMWLALGRGKRLKLILEDFYSKVLADDLLAPFFKGVTKNHIIGKQYAFLNQVYTGKDCYFGDRPRNAHHWMIISDSLFDHREKLFADSCIKHGLQEPYLSQLLSLDESYRETIVKTKVWPRITDGEIKPIKGFDDMILDIGSLCDGCEKELEPGDKVHYHDRTGEMFCQECQNK